MADTSIEMQMVASIFISSGVHNVSGELPFPEFLQGKVKLDRASVLSPVHPGGYPGGILYCPSSFDFRIQVE